MSLFDRLKQILTPDASPVHEMQMDMTQDNKQIKVGNLTPREYDLYLLLLEGYTLKESAKQLSIKYSTANTYITAIYKKLGVNSRAGLIINYRGIKVPIDRLK